MIILSPRARTCLMNVIPFSLHDRVEKRLTPTKDLALSSFALSICTEETKAS